MNDLREFGFEGKAVRVVMVNDEPWWVAKDVCAVLGYASHANAISRHCIGIPKHYSFQTAGGMQEVRIISEPDLFRLVVSSHLPKAKKFEKWVFEDILPSIRKMGGYLNPSVNFSDYDTVRALFDEWHEKTKKSNKKQESSKIEQECGFDDTWKIVEKIDDIASEINPISIYMGYVYIMEYGKYIKIGQTHNIRKRMKQLISIGNYGDMAMGRVMYTIPHTNYKENEKRLHSLFSSNRKKGTELFSIDFNSIMEIPPALEYRNDTKALSEKRDRTFNGLKNFVLGKDILRMQY